MNTFLPPTGPMSSPVVTPNLYKPVPSPHSLATPSSSQPPPLADLPSPSAGALVGGVPPLNHAGLVLDSPQEGHLPAPGTHQGNCPDRVLLVSPPCPTVSNSLTPPCRSRSHSCPDSKRAASLGPHPEHQFPGLRSRDADLGAT